MHPFSCWFNKESKTKILNFCIYSAAAVVMCDPVGLMGTAETVVMAEGKIMEPGFPPVAMVFDLATHLGAVGTVGHLMVCVDLSRLGSSVELNGWCKQSIFFYPNHPGEEGLKCSSHSLAVEHVGKSDRSQNNCCFCSHGTCWTKKILAELKCQKKPFGLEDNNRTENVHS